MAEVYLASLRGPSGFDRSVVVKKIHPRWSDNEDVLALFRDEARLGSRLDHPNVVQVLDFGRSGSSAYLVMEWVEGRNAADALAAAEDMLDPIPQEIVAWIGSEVAAALDHIHNLKNREGASLGIVHRDLNPANVLLSLAGEVKLTDFGVAAGSHRELKTEHGIIRGTFPYMSPEQTRCRPVDGRSDLFSLGICLYELLTGRHPFAAEEDWETVERIQTLVTPPPMSLRPELDPALDRLVMRCLEKEVEARPASARQLRQELLDWLRTRRSQLGSAALIRLMARLFPRGLDIGEDVPPEEIELGPTHPGRPAPLLDLTSLERPVRARPQAPPPPVEPGNSAKIYRLGRPQSEPDARAPGPTESTIRRRADPTQGFLPSATESQEWAPWELQKFRAAVASSDTVLSARSFADDSSMISLTGIPPTKLPSHARRLLPWIGLSLAAVLLCVVGWISSTA